MRKSGDEKHVMKEVWGIVTRAFFGPWPVWGASCDTLTLSWPVHLQMSADRIVVRLFKCGYLFQSHLFSTKKRRHSYKISINNLIRKNKLRPKNTDRDAFDADFRIHENEEI